MRNGSRWSVGSRLLLALSAAMIIPACDDLVVGPPGAPGTGFTVVASWADPVNLSNRVVNDGESAYGQQAVFTPDGRLHVVYLAYDSDSDGDQVWYTSAAPPFTTWDAPVRISGDGTDMTRYPNDGDLTAASDNSVHAAISENASAGGVGIDSVTALTGVYTLDAARAASLTVGTIVNISGTTGNDGTFTVTAVGANSITVNNGASVLEAGSGGTLSYNTSRIIYTKNTSAARSTFTESVVSSDFNSTNLIFSPKVAVRGTVGHVVWADQTGTGFGTPLTFFHSHNGSGTFLATPTTLDVVDWNSLVEELVMLNDAAGNTHLVYNHNNGGSNEEQIRYRSIPQSAGNAGAFGTAQIANDTSSENSLLISSGQGVNELKLDGSNNVYVFWKQNATSGNSSRAVYGNFKSATGSFVRANAVAVTDTVEGDHISFGVWQEVVDIEVTSDGVLHAAWRVRQSNGPRDLFPVYYRTRSAAGVWSTAEVAAWAAVTTYDSTGIADFGSEQSVLVRSASDGTVHLFYSDESLSYDLFHAWKGVGSSIWRNGGNFTRAANLAFYPTDGFNFNYFVGAGVTSGGEPWVIYLVDADGTNEVHGDLVFTQRIAGQWPIGVDVNGPNEVRRSGTFWVDTDADGKVHALWQERVDPFNNQWDYDVMHANQQ